MATITVHPGDSIQAAIDAASPGDTILVEDGIFKQKVAIPKSNIVLRSKNPWGAVVDGDNYRLDEAIRITNNATGVLVEGFEVRYFGNPNGSGTGIGLYSGGRNSIVRGNHIHHIGQVCTDTGNGQAGVYLKQSGVIVEGNYIHDIGRLAPEQGCPNAWGYENHDHGVYTSASGTSLNGTRIRGNFFKTHERGWAIHVYPGTWDDVEITDNIFVGGNPYRDMNAIIASDLDASDFLIARNTFYAPPGETIKFRNSSLSGIVVRDNVTTQGDLVVFDGANASGVSETNNTINAQIAEPVPPAGGGGPPPDPDPPPAHAPPVLSVGAVTNSAVTLTWAKLAGVTGYELDKDGVKVSTAGVNAISAKFGNLPPIPMELGVTAIYPDGGKARSSKTTFREVE